MTDVSQTVKGLVNRMADAYERVQWVTCPICNEDWNRLQEVVCFIESNGRYQRKTVKTCPPCGRSVRSCGWFAEHFGIGFDSSGEIHRVSSYRGLQRDMVGSNGLYIRFVDGTRIQPDGDKVHVYREGQDRKSFDNIPQAMLFLSQGEPVSKEKVSW